MTKPRLRGRFDREGNDGRFEITISRAGGVGAPHKLEFWSWRGAPDEAPHWSLLLQVAETTLPWSAGQQLTVAGGSGPIHLLCIATEMSSGDKWGAQIDAEVGGIWSYDEVLEPWMGAAASGHIVEWERHVSKRQPQIGGSIGFKRIKATGKVQVQASETYPIHIEVPHGDPHPPFDRVEVWIESRMQLWCFERRIITRCHLANYAMKTANADVDAFVYPYNSLLDASPDTQFALHAMVRFEDEGATRYWRYRSQPFKIPEVGPLPDLDLKIERSLGTTSRGPTQV
jgi:hypothetical protein